MTFYNTSTVLVQTGATVLSDNVWYRIEAKITTGAVPTAYEVKINGTSELSGNADQNNVNNGALGLGKHTDVSSQTVEYWFDDIAISSDAYPGAGEIVRMDPDGIGTDTGFKSNVDDGPATLANVSTMPWLDGPVTYAYADAVLSQTWSLESAAAAGITGTVKAVSSVIYSRAVGAGVIKVRTRSGANVDETTAYAASGYDSQGKCYSSEPVSGDAWTTALLNSLEIGATSDSVNVVRVAGVIAEVEFDSGGGVVPYLVKRGLGFKAGTKQIPS